MQKYGEGGHAYIGRLAALLDPASSEFKMVAPHFREDVAPEIIDMVVMAIFGDIKPAGFKRAAPYLAASLLYHHDWILDNIAPNHPLRSSMFLNIDKQTLMKWKQLVTVETGNIRLTGVPSHVFSMEKTEKTMQKVI